MLLLTASFSRVEPPWPDAGASSYSHIHDQSSIFKSVHLTVDVRWECLRNGVDEFGFWCQRQVNQGWWQIAY